MIDSLVLTGSVAWLALSVLVLELVLVMLLSGRQRSMLPFAANAMSGVCLILALRACLVGQGGTAVAVWLGLGFVAHLGDTLLRLRR